MVTEGILLRHKISNAGLEVDPAKIDAVSKLPPSSDVKPLRSFLRHARFYRRFINEFFKIVKPLSNMIYVNQPFNFDEKYHQAFQTLRDVLTSASILISPDWSQPFDMAVKAMLCQKKDKVIHPICYTSKTFNEAQENCITTEKELLMIVFAIEK